MTIALFLHVMADVIWVGGMFLAYMAVRPAAAEVLEPPQRLRLWTGIFSRFFPGVWASVALLLATGFFMMGQMGAVPPYVIAMTAIGIVMSMIFAHLFFAPFARLKRAVGAEDWKAGAAALNPIRLMVATHLTLGILNIAVAIVGRNM